MSNGASFRTTVAEMQQASINVTTVAEQIDAEMRRLDNLIQPLQGAWQSDAASTYMNLHRTWVERQTKLRAVLDDIAAGIKLNGAAYQRNDDDNQSMFTQTAGLLA